MPRLSYPKITKGHAVDSLLKLYRNDQQFAQELDKIRDPYLDLIIQCAVDSFYSGRKSGSSLRETFDAVAKNGKNLQREVPLFPEASTYAAQLQPYLDALSKLAHRWRLRAPWAVPTLVIYDMFDVLRIKGLIPDEIDMQLEEFDSLYPWPPPLPTLEIKIPAWAIVLQGREKVLAEVGTRLCQYEDDLKATGLVEYPSSLQKHASWWFEHFVHGRKYDDIAEKEIRTPGGSVISYARNVGQAVRKFSRLVGIDAKNLRRKG